MTQLNIKIAPANSGVVTSIRGSAVDMRFEGYLPSITTLLRTGKVPIRVTRIYTLKLCYRRGNTPFDHSDLHGIVHN